MIRVADAVGRLVWPAALAFASAACALGSSLATLLSTFWTRAWSFGRAEHTVVDGVIAGLVARVPVDPVDPVAAPAIPARPSVMAPTTAVPAMICAKHGSSLDVWALVAHLPSLDGTSYC